MALEKNLIIKNYNKKLQFKKIFKKRKFTTNSCYNKFYDFNKILFYYLGQLFKNRKKIAL